MDDNDIVSPKEMLLKLRRLQQARKSIEGQKRGDSKGYSMEGMRLVALLNQLQALQAVQGLQELAPDRKNSARRFKFSDSADERKSQRQWLMFKADWLESLLEDTVSELEALNEFEGVPGGSAIEKRIFERKLILPPSLNEVSVVSQDARKLPCRILDYSAGGLRLDLKEYLDIGVRLNVHLGEDLVMDSTVMWSVALEDACQLGVRFDMEPEAVYEIIKRCFG